MYISEILRLFRKNIKQRYERIYGKTSDRRWSEERLRRNIKDFFTCKDTEPGFKNGYSFQSDFYDANEIIFCSLIQQKKSEESYWITEGKIDPHTIHLAKVIMKDMFGNKANKHNITKFFECEAIQALWFECQNENIVSRP